MVEFKVSADGTPYLMEVNARFWGSLQLAVDAGVDFPWLLYQLATDRDLGSVNGYAVGVKSRWLWGDFKRLCKVLAGSELPPGLRFPGRMRSIFQFFNFFDSHTRCEESRWYDLKPLFLQLAKSASHWLSKIIA